MTDSLRAAAALDSSTSARAIVQERVRAMESLAGVIAREIRSSVLGVTSAAQLLRYSLPQDPAAEKSLGRILQEAERLSALHESLTEYATEIPPRLVVGDPDAVWDAVVGNMRGVLEANSIVVVHEGAAAMVALDESQLGRAFERVIHHIIGGWRGGSEVRVTSTANDHDWSCSVIVVPFQAASQKMDGAPDRSSILLALADRTVVAHGGETVVRAAEDSSLVVSIRLPLSTESDD